MVKAGRTRRPRPAGHAGGDHSGLVPILDALRSGGVGALVDRRPALAAYRAGLEAVDPDTLSRAAALAYWIKLYNAGALDLAGRAWRESAQTVLRIPGAFGATWATVAGEELSLDDIEHGKIRRFGDPRIHAALVCGSASCPTLRYEPYEGSGVDDQLDDQMRDFLRNGGLVADRAGNTVLLSRILLWYGADFVRPHRMPSWLPAGRRRVLAAITSWLEASPATWIAEHRPDVAFQPYDWSLACTVR